MGLGDMGDKAEEEEKEERAESVADELGVSSVEELEELRDTVKTQRERELEMDKKIEELADEVLVLKSALSTALEEVNILQEEVAELQDSGTGGEDEEYVKEVEDDSPTWKA